MAFRSDLQAAHDRITSLEQENKRLRERREDSPIKDPKVKCKTCGGRGHRVGMILFGLLGGAAVGIVILALLFLAGNAIANRSDGDCYVESEAMTFKLKRVVNWGGDRVLGQYRTMEELLSDAVKVGCPVK